MLLAGVDKDMVVDVTSEPFAPPRTLSKDTVVSLRVDYNATTVHVRAEVAGGGVVR